MVGIRRGVLRGPSLACRKRSGIALSFYFFLRFRGNLSVLVGFGVKQSGLVVSGPRSSDLCSGHFGACVDVLGDAERRLLRVCICVSVDDRACPARLTCNRTAVVVACR